MYRLTFWVCLQWLNRVYAISQQHGPCDDNIYLEIGKPGVVSCSFQDFHILGWILGEDDIGRASPFIYLENSSKNGHGHRNGQYDIHPNGSLIINRVSLKHENRYTSLFVYANGTRWYTKVAVNVYERPVPDFPVLNGLPVEQHVTVMADSDVIVNCAVNRIRPKVELEWVYPPDVIELVQNLTYSIDYGNGTFGVFLNSKFKIISSDVGDLSVYCKIVGPMARLFTPHNMIPLRLSIGNATEDYINGLTTENFPDEGETERSFYCNTVCGILKAETYATISLVFLSLVL